MLQSLNFKHLFYFWVVAKESSVSKAAILVNVSQSSISEQIKTLESRIGINLFDRAQKKMILTSSGRVLFNALNDFFPSIEELFESLTNHKTPDVKFLRIGLCPALSPELRFKLCFPFIEDYHYTVKILQGENQFLLEAFNQDQIDMIYTTNANMTPLGKYEKYVLSEKQFCIIINNEVYEKMPKTKKLKALSDCKYINYTPDSDLHFKIHNFIHKNDISPMRIAEIDDIGLIKETVKNLDCFSILPLNAVKDELKRGEFKKISSPVDSVECMVSAIYKTQFHSDIFIDHLDKISKNSLW